MKTKSLVQDIIEKYKNNEYTVLLLKKDISLPENVDIKNVLFYFFMYIWYKNNNDNYCNELLDFVLIPNNIDYKFSKIKSTRRYVKIHHYIKYNIQNQNILLKN